MICPHVVIRRQRAPKASGAPIVHLSAQEPSREELIRERAFLRAERRGFAPGAELDDWLAAEREVDHWLATRGAPARYRMPD